MPFFPSFLICFLYFLFSLRTLFFLSLPHIGSPFILFLLIRSTFFFRLMYSSLFSSCFLRYALVSSLSICSRFSLSFSLVICSCSLSFSSLSLSRFSFSISFSWYAFAPSLFRFLCSLFLRLRLCFRPHSFSLRSHTHAHKPHYIAIAAIIITIRSSSSSLRNFSSRVWAHSVCRDVSCPVPSRPRRLPVMGGEEACVRPPAGVRRRGRSGVAGVGGLGAPWCLAGVAVAAAAAAGAE